MKKLFFLPLVALIFTGCSDDDDNNGIQDEIVPISINSRLVVEPRESRQDTQIAKDQQLSFFVTKHNNIIDTVYNNAILTADGLGNFSYSYYGDTTLYYPLDNENVDFISIHPYRADISLTENMGFSVIEDQSNIRNFLNSDLLYCKVTNIPKSRNGILMSYRHKLVKVSFVIVEGVGSDLTQLNGIEILNVESETTMDPSDGSLGTISTTPVNIIPYGVRPASSATENELDNISAIIVPQTFTGNNPLFKFTLGSTEFFYTPSQNINFEEGKRYNYRITITNAGIEVTSEIQDWLPGSDTEGEGVIQ